MTSLARFEDGTALVGDSAPARCGCGQLAVPTRYDELRLFVPRQSRYPVRVLGWTVGKASDGTRVTELTVVTRASATAPWRISFHSATTAAGRPPAPGKDEHGDDPAPSASAHRVAAASPAALAALWQRAKRTGTVGSLGRFRPGERTSVQAGKHAVHPDGTVQENGLLSKNRFWADPKDRLYEFTAADGTEVACGVVHREVVYRGRRGQPPVQDPARANWGPELAPGRYSAITVRSQSQSCFLVPRGGHGVDVLGGDPKNESVATGTR